MSAHARTPTANLPPPANTSPGLTCRCLIRAGRLAQRRSPFHAGDGLQKTTRGDAYAQWRHDSLREQFERHFNIDSLANCNVVDFGCGGGELSLFLARSTRCRMVTGLDVSARSIESADASRRRLPVDQRRRVWFRVARDNRRIDLPSDSTDVICCFDVLEHILHVGDIVKEWRRILKPGGEVWIWWSPWRGPYGHHVESLLPVPWVHLFLRPATIFRACAEMYDAPTFTPRLWDIDPATRKKRANKWRHVRSYQPFLNQMTRPTLERIVHRSGLKIIHRRRYGFSGSKLSRTTKPLTYLPVVGECFVSYFVYRLFRPDSE